MLPHKSEGIPCTGRRLQRVQEALLTPLLLSRCSSPHPADAATRQPYAYSLIVTTKSHKAAGILHSSSVWLRCCFQPHFPHVLLANWSLRQAHKYWPFLQQYGSRDGTQ